MDMLIFEEARPFTQQQWLYALRMRDKPLTEPMSKEDIRRRRMEGKDMHVQYESVTQ